MPDVMKYIVDNNAAKNDPELNLASLDEWSEDAAIDRAREQNVSLTPKHWEVIYFLRDFYRIHGPAQDSRPVHHALVKKFEERGGQKYLQMLFPLGAVNQGSMIAGLPVPPYSSNPSKGSTL